MYHVFVVNDNTFKFHLEYLFAGICALSNPDFLENSEYQNPRRKNDGLTSKQELSICGMIADVSRIRPGDKVIFYLTQNEKHEGLFFGIFEVKERAFFDPNNNNYLADSLKVNLNFRVELLPDKVYPFGITEREALDSLSGISHPSQMCWSLIYRKLKGKRGCTMITDYEAMRLINLIEKKNEKNVLNGKYFSYNPDTCSIIEHAECRNYEGTKLSIDILDRMLVKAKRKKAYEAHLQAYILQNIDTAPLKSLFNFNENTELWIGNEVSCGVGMQSIDIMTEQVDEKNCIINIIELKCEEPYERILKYQLPKYVEWVRDYIVPLYAKKNIIINPIVLAKKIAKSNDLSNYIQLCNTYPKQSIGNITINPVKYIGYDISESVCFEELN